MVALNVLASITKSVTSTLIGICIDKGFIKNVDESVLALIPHYTKGMPNDPKKRAIKLRHIMTMSSGLEWLEHGTSYNDTQNSEWQMVDSEDWMAYVLNKPMQDKPGERYVYNTGAMHLLSAVIQNVSGLRTNGWGSQPLRTRDIAKFGYGGQTLYLFPEFDVIIVFTCELTDRNSRVSIPLQKIIDVIFDSEVTR